MLFFSIALKAKEKLSCLVVHMILFLKQPPSLPDRFAEAKLIATACRSRASNNAGGYAEEHEK